METAEVLVEDLGGVRTLVLNRPERKNAWTYELEDRLFAAIDAAAVDPSVRALVLTGAGTSFSPGMDTSVLQSRVGEGAGPAPRQRDRLVTSFAELPFLTVAAINGACAGIGLVHALLCDLRFAVRGAKISTAFARRGIIAEFGMTWVLPRMIGSSRAADLLISGRTITAEEGERLGIINRLFDTVEELREATQHYAEDVARNCAPGAVAHIKSQLRADWHRSLGEAERAAIELGSTDERKADFHEGVTSFVERRAPAFAPRAI